jgi:hypothetical protein
MKYKGPPQSITHKALVRKMLRRPTVKAEYDGLAEEFAYLDEL